MKTDVRARPGYLRQWGFLAAGSTLFVLSLPLYESWESRVVLERWSYAYAAVLAFVCAAWLAGLWATWRLARRAPAERALASHAPGAPAVALWQDALGIGVLLWGAAYCVSSLDDRASAGRFLEVNLFGSVTPAALMLEWLSMVALALATATYAAARMSRGRQDVALLLGTVATLGLLAEGATRSAVLISPAVTGFPTYSAALWHRRHVETNSLGYRDVEPREDKPQGARRVVLLGDSFTFGTGVTNVRDRFGERLLERLERLEPGRWDVLNAGREDTHTLQHLEALPAVLALEPDMVVLLYVFNDMDYLAPLTDRRSVVHARGFPGLLHPGRVLYVNSYAYQALYVRVRKIVTRGAAAEADPYDDDALLAAHVSDLARLVETAERAGAALRIVPFDNTVALRESAQRYRRFEAAAEAADLPLCGIASAFDGHALDALVVNALDAHPNALANQLAAEAALPCLVEGLGLGLSSARGGR